MKWFSRKPFAALLISMALVAFLPLLLNNLFYIRFRNTVQDQQESLTEESLRFSVQQIDRTLLELTATGMQLSNQYQRLDIPAEKDMTSASRMELWEVRYQLKKEISIGSEYVSAIYLYSSDSGRAIGNYSLYSEEMLYRGLYSSRGIPRETVDLLHRTYSHGQLIALSDENLVFAVSIGKNADGTPKKQLVLLLKPSFYSALIDKANVEGGVFLLLDNAGTVLALSNKTGADLDAAALEQLTTARPADGFPLSGSPARLFSLSSAIGGYQVKAAVPYSHFLDSSREMQKYYWILLTASVGLGLALAVFFSRRNVMPINQMIAYIRKNYGSSGGTQGLEQIKTAVDSLLDQRRSDQEQLRLYESAIARNRLRDSLRGDAAEGEGFTLPAGCRYVVVCFSAPHSCTQEELTWIGKAQAVLPESCFCHSLLLDGTVVEVLGSAGPDFTEDAAEELLTAQINWMDQENAPAVTAAFSNLHTDPRELDRAYGEAAMALDFSGEEDDAVLISFSSCRFRSSSLLRDWHHLDKQLLFSGLVGDGEFDEAAQLLPGLFPTEFLDEYFPESDISSLHLASLKFQFLHDSDNLRNNLNIPDEDWTRLFQDLLYCRTHRKLFFLMKDLLKQAADASPRLPADSENGRINEIKQYISQNYADPQLSVSSIAEAFGLSANNLSQLFSRKSDQGVLDYIHKIRMEKAAELLRKNQNLTIQEIAAQTGYASILTFNRKFKAFYGQTPTEYRKGLSRS